MGTPKRESFQQRKRRALLIVKKLLKEYPSDRVALHHQNPFQLAVAVILSAQCTDARVNLVTPALFQRFPTPQSFAAAPIVEVEQLIRSTGFYHNKAKNIVGFATTLLERHNGIVPHTLRELVALPGVGRKTANVVLGAAFGKVEGVVVDTHVMRLSRLLGLTESDDPVKIERDLMPLIPQKKWFHFSHSLILHGRSVCPARRPKCNNCIVRTYCPSAQVTR